jgi:hypothetical protein
MEALWLIFIGFVIALIAVMLRRYFAEFPGQRPEHYADLSPEFDLRTHLNGAMLCEGVIFGPLGRVTSSFVADFDVTWDGNKGRIDEEFVYNDRSTQTRAWDLVLGERDTFTATAEDVPGTAKGVIRGPSVFMSYPIRLPAESGGHVLKAKDWMYLTDAGTIVNRSQFRMFGFKVAELVAIIRPKGAS